MKRLLLLGLLAWPGLASAANQVSIATVAGTLSISCGAAGKAKGWDGAFQYELDGHPIRGLRKECFPEDGANGVGIEKSWRSPTQTTVIAIEGVSAIYQNVRMFHFRKGAPPLMVDTFGGDVTFSKQFTATKYRMIVENKGFAVSADRMSHWQCQYEVDFATRLVEVSLIGPREAGITGEQCGKVAVRGLRVG